MAMAEKLFPDFDNKDCITKKKRITIVQFNYYEADRQHRQISDPLPCFSFAVEENTDVTDVGRLCVFGEVPERKLFEKKKKFFLPLFG